MSAPHSIAPAEYARGIQAMLDDNRGGRMNCCIRGMCATHLAEDHPAGGTASTVHTANGHAVVPNYGSQELAAAFARAAYQDGLARLGLQ